MTSSLISIVAPVHNEEEVIGEFHRRLHLALEKIDARSEIIYVDDGSTDRTPALLAELRSRHSNVVVLTLSRCFGHQMALTAGMDQASGDAVVIIDSDLQDPPELIGEMVARWRAGVQVVYGKRLSREGESHFKLGTADLFYWLINIISDVYIPANAGDFRLMDRVVLDALKAMPECHRMLRAMVSWVGFRQEPLPYHRDARYAGTTKYSLRKMIALALDGLVNFSTLPLRLVSILSLVILVLATGFGIGAIVMWAVTGVWLSQTLTMLLVVALFSGTQLFCFGIMGEYVGRIYGEIKRRPLYLVARRDGPPAKG